MKEIKEKLQSIIEHAGCDKPACKNCVSYKNGGCSFGCVNERMRLTAPNYSCDNFNCVYSLNENTLESLKALLKDVERIEEGVKNLDLFLDGKIDEKDLAEIIG